MSEHNNGNIIKEVRERYNLSYSELSKITGASESMLKNSASSGKISDIIRKSIEWYIVSREKDQELEKIEHVKTFFRDFLGIK